MSGRYSATTRLHLSEPWRSGTGKGRATDVAYFSLRLLSPSFDNERLYAQTSQAQIHSFIHYGDLYSAPSRLLLRSAPDPCTTKKKSFETRVECVRKNPG